MKFKLLSGKPLLALTTLVLIGAAVGGYFYWGSRATAEEYITAKIERGQVRNTVNATGTLQAVTTVQVGSQVSGNIKALYVDFNSSVKKGQIVAQLDPSILQAQVEQQRANLENARASLADAQARVMAAESSIENLRAGVSSARANLEALKAQRDDARNNYNRMESLASSGIINQREIETARTSLQSAEARYNQASAQVQQAQVSEQQAAKSGLAQAQASVKQAQAQVQQTQASLRLAEVNLSNTTIHSPINGVVVSRNVDVGQTVAASLSAPTLFTIANDLTQMQVIANIDQADIGVINSNNRINFTVDAFPGQNFNGTISQIRLNPQNVQNVVTYNVVIDVSNPDLKLKPGMTANLTVTIAERTDVLKVPNAALRFRPADITQEKLREMMRGERGGEGGGQPPAAAAQAKPEGQPAAAAGGAAAGEPRGQRPAGETGRRREGGGAGAPNGGGERAPTTAIVQGQRRVVWVLGPDGKPQMRRVRLGITDGVTTEVTEGELKEGEAVITALNSGGGARPASSTQRAPGFGGPGGGMGGGGRR
jgi:HlyD family secretion protein